MTPIKKGLVLPREEYYVKHLEVLNVILPEKLTGKEIQILSSFMSLPLSMVEDDRFNTLARKQVKKHCEISDASLSNHLGNMIEKKFLFRSQITNKITINELILAGDSGQAYTILFKVAKDEQGGT